MTDKITDAEVKKALKEYIEFADFEYTEYTSIRLDILKNALDLINRLEGENKKNENIIRIADKTIATLNAENESLKAEVERLRDNNNLLTEAGQEWQRRYKTAKAEAYKELAERLREKTKWLFSSVSINNEIDNLLNELAGD